MTNPPPTKPGRDIAGLLDIMRALRGPDGCPWDRAQSFSFRKQISDRPFLPVLPSS